MNCEANVRERERERERERDREKERRRRRRRRMNGGIGKLRRRKFFLLQNCSLDIYERTHTAEKFFLHMKAI